MTEASGSPPPGPGPAAGGPPQAAGSVPAPTVPAPTGPAPTGPARRSRRRSTRTPRAGTAARLVRTIPRRQAVEIAGGSSLTLLVLASHVEDTAAVDVASGALVRARICWPEDHDPDLAPFDVVEAVLADEPERDDLAQPEAVTVSGLPRHIGTLHGRYAKRLLHELTTPVEEHLLGFPGASAPYWEFRGARPSSALVVPTKGPVLFRRSGDRQVWARFGWGRSDNWLPVEDAGARRALDVARRERLAGKDLSSALGFKPHYLVVSLSAPRDGHSYKTVRAILPRS